MEKVVKFIQKANRVMDGIAGTFCVAMMLLTVADVILRYMRHPIPGTYELVALMGAIVVGFALPRTSWDGGHTTLDLLLDKYPKSRHTFSVITRIISLALFILLWWNFIAFGKNIMRTGEGTLTLQLPIYPIHFALAFCCLMVCLVLIADIIRIKNAGVENE